MSYIKKWWVAFSRDDVFSDHRKVINGHDVIKEINRTGLTLEDIGKKCGGLSKTTVSNWMNFNEKSLPRYGQIKPLLEELGIGRFEVELEPLSPAAIEYPERKNKIITSILVILMLMTVFVVMYFSSWKPCFDNWDECNQLSWYEMPNYRHLQFKKEVDEFREWKRLSHD